jgi:F-box/leucine-rich repeat protein 2/20
MLQTVDLRFTGCASDWPSEIGFTQNGFLVLIQSCPIRILVLNTANFYDDDGMKALSFSPYLVRQDFLSTILTIPSTWAVQRCIKIRASTFFSS